MDVRLEKVAVYDGERVCHSLMMIAADVCIGLCGVMPLFVSRVVRQLCLNWLIQHSGRFP